MDISRIMRNLHLLILLMSCNEEEATRNELLVLCKVFRSESREILSRIEVFSELLNGDLFNQLSLFLRIYHRRAIPRELQIDFAFVGHTDVSGDSFNLCLDLVS